MLSVLVLVLPAVAALVMPSAPMGSRAVAMRATRPAMLAEFAQPETLDAIQSTLMLADESSLEMAQDLSAGGSVVLLAAFAAVVYVLFEVLKLVAEPALKLGFVVAAFELFGGMVPPL